MMKQKRQELNASVDAHFYASSVGRWATNRDLRRLIEIMDSDHLPYVVWFVPLPADASYKINNYAPVVDGIIRLTQLPSFDE